MKDGAFAAKMMGDGFAVIPEENVVRALCNGKIQTLSKTKHAVGIKTEAGQELLIHIGIDTVKLKGEGFEGIVYGFSSAGGYGEASPKVRRLWGSLLQAERDRPSLYGMVNMIIVRLHQNSKFSPFD